MRSLLVPFAASTLLVLSACGAISPTGLLDSTSDRATIGDAGYVADVTVPVITDDGHAPEPEPSADATSDVTETDAGAAPDAALADAALADAGGADASQPPKNGAVACAGTNGQTTYCTPGEACCIQSGPPGQG